MIVDKLPNFVNNVIGIDLETTTRHTFGDVSNPWEDEIVAVGVSDGQNSYILIKDFAQLAPILEDRSICKIFQNAKFDLSFIKHKLGVDTVNIYDTMLSERVLNAGNEVPADLGSIAARRLGVMLDKQYQTSFDGSELSYEQQQYIIGDVKHLPAIRKSQIEDIGRQGLGRVIALENRVVLSVVEMYLEGVCFDWDLWREISGSQQWNKMDSTIQHKLVEIEKRIADRIDAPQQYSLFDGQPALMINLGSPAQVTKLFKDFGIAVDNTREETLKTYLDEFPDTPIIDDVLEWRKWNKMQDWQYDKYINPVTGRIHPDWNQHGARTGRFACKDPNLMNVPRPAPDEPNFRALFIPDGDYVYIIADYSQQEPRIFGQISGDGKLQHACSEEDVYVALARDILGRDVSKDSVERFDMKTGVLATLYGAQAKRISHVLSISMSEAEEFISAVRRTYPTAAAWSSQQELRLVQTGYTTTLLGRRRYFTGIDGDNVWKLKNMAVNTPIQGSGADMIKMGMVAIYDYIKESGVNAIPVLQVHDELVIKVHKDEADQLLYQVIGAFETEGEKLCPNVKIIAEAKVSERWSK